MGQAFPIYVIGGRSCLHMAAEKGNHRMVSSLLRFAAARGRAPLGAFLAMEDNDGLDAREIVMERLATTAGSRERLHQDLIFGMGGDPWPGKAFLGHQAWTSEDSIDEP